MALLPAYVASLVGYAVGFPALLSYICNAASERSDAFLALGDVFYVVLVGASVKTFTCSLRPSMETMTEACDTVTRLPLVGG